MRGNINPFSSSEFVLLGLIFEKPTHGYDLHHVINDPEGIGIIWRVKMSNLYAYLDKLEKKGNIKGTMQPGESHPTRMEYQITETGRVAFESWLSTIVLHPRDFRQEFMIRYYFWLIYQPKNIRQYCDQQLVECNTWLENTKVQEQQVSNQKHFKNSILHFRVIQISSLIQWLEWQISQPL